MAGVSGRAPARPPACARGVVLSCGSQWPLDSPALGKNMVQAEHRPWQLQIIGHFATEATTKVMHEAAADHSGAQTAATILNALWVPPETCPALGARPLVR